MQPAGRFAGAVPQGINEEDEKPLNIIHELMGHGSLRKKRRDKGPDLTSVVLPRRGPASKAQQFR